MWILYMHVTSNSCLYNFKMLSQHFVMMYVLKNLDCTITCILSRDVLCSITLHFVIFESLKVEHSIVNTWIFLLQFIWWELVNKWLFYAAKRLKLLVIGPFPCHCLGLIAIGNVRKVNPFSQYLNDHIFITTCPILMIDGLFCL